MQTSKFIIALGAVTIISLSSPLHAQETDAQAKAREALRQKINELNSATATSAPVAPVAPQAPAAPVVVAPEPPPVVVVTPAAIPVVSTEAAYSAAPVTLDDATTQRAREALRQKMLELDTQSQSQSATATATAPGVTYTPIPASTPQATSGVNPVTGAPTATFRPIEAAPSPLSGSKEARLSQLLQQYRADQITPEQYHTQRAAIIAEP